MYNIVIPDQHEAWYIDVPDSLCLTILYFSSCREMGMNHKKVETTEEIKQKSNGEWRTFIYKSFYKNQPTHLYCDNFLRFNFLVLL